ncbi:hypothetical protein LSH36_1334g00010 [Paralvinella palmiformis]|uniref:Fibronectin type-III domain-containing protein n=1 Tax=Paralvinella palmiformis TaxID=53620 RepID=A0AAD9MPE7_9ANNE|nr:hypothetical protein LSH36_1334g00010 [Paralvinella palmiformis]
MLDIKLLVWVVAVYSLPLNCTGRCLFGNSDGCVFKCHCAKVSECNEPEVSCPGGCASGILGYNWTGPACQIGCGLDKYRNDFMIRVSTTDPDSDPGVVCITINSDTIPPPTYTISCPDKTIGRYVYFSRLPQGYEPNRMVLCEMIVIGYKQIDCSRCPADVTCNDVIGCKRCIGSYRPDCKQDIPQATNKSVSTLTSNGTSLTLEWIQITVDKDIVSFYGYEIRHKRSNDTQFVKEVNIVRHQVGSSSNKVIIKDLVANTWYDVVIYPYREWSDEKDYGLPYDTVKGQTKCTSPDNPKLSSVLSVPIIVDKRDKVDVIFQDLQNLYSGCDALSKAWLRYRLKEYIKGNRIKLNLKTQTSSFEPEYGGTYLVWLIVENNDALNASSDIWNVTGKPTWYDGNKENRPSTSKRTKVLPVTIIIVSVVGVICLIIVIVTAISCVRRRRIKRFKERINEDPHQKEENDYLEEEMIDVRGRVVSTLPQLPPRRKKLSSVGDTGISNGVYQNFELEPIKDVNMEDFEDYVNRRMDTDQFVEEYASLPPADQDRCFIAMSEANIKCNRYRKIYP